MSNESRHIAVLIERPVQVVYDYVVEAANLSEWASGLSSSTELIDGSWFADSPMGRVEVSFAPRNSFGVLDHDVRLESGEVFANPMRVLAHPAGAEVVFTVRRQPGVTEADFEADAETVRRDLETLKAILERGR